MGFWGKIFGGRRENERTQACNCFDLCFLKKKKKKKKENAEDKRGLCHVTFVITVESRRLYMFAIVLMVLVELPLPNLTLW
jgi:hypothetical protein